MPNSFQDYIVLGFDFGLKHIGVAVGQTVTGTANPLTSLKAHQGKPVWEEITALIAYWEPKKLLVGLPFGINGEETTITRAARSFAQHLKQYSQLPVHLIDERFTTLEARQSLFDQGGFRATIDKNKLDGFSAKIITESGLKLCEILLPSSS